jgi:hypothetical protein
MIIDELKLHARDKICLEQRLEAKSKEIKILKDDMENL